ncbi:probable serine/threonine-protein kinase yakA [Belonocnema kinseyi]|uniref:probable serine/threonine-protein kinase yakA n=1 Tax=Belonocnema kinseyi TaxID=2817044 RepID=UPI00143DCC3B|nr:probable serine/threonine-protein kinase yakA [Belonocnema kinseyi]
MKDYILFTLLFVTVLGEKRVNLEDIERDNLYLETKTDDVADSKYNIKSEQDQYQGSTNLYESQNNQPTTYTDLQSVKGSKYAPEEYSQQSKYSQNKAVYQKQQQTIESGSQPFDQPIQYYTELVPESSPQTTHKSQQIVYQPELIVGNKIQTLQQKAAAGKYIKSFNKDPIYVNIPATQLFSYYQNLEFNKANSKTQPQPLLHRLAADPNQHTSLPHSNSLKQNQFHTPGKFAIQIQPQYVTYAPKYPSHSQSTVTKGYKNNIYTVSADMKAYTTPQILSSPVYTQAEPAHSQPKSLFYLPQQQQQPSPYFPQFIYTEPKAFYSQASPVYADLYAGSPAFLPDNTINGHGNQNSPIQQFYVPTAIDEQLVKLLQQSKIRVSSQQHAKDPEKPRENFVPPQLPAQKFRSSVTQLLPVSTGSESVPAKSFMQSTEPKSLLDTYIPSYLIAAQDTERYMERPIKLEGGFLPSKINFIHSYKKRKSE